MYSKVTDQNVPVVLFFHVACDLPNLCQGNATEVTLVEIVPVSPVVGRAVSPWRWDFFFQVFIYKALRTRFVQ